MKKKDYPKISSRGLSQSTNTQAYFTNASTTPHNQNQINKSNISNGGGITIGISNIAVQNDKSGIVLPYLTDRNKEAGKSQLKSRSSNKVPTTGDFSPNVEELKD